MQGWLLMNRFCLGLSIRVINEIICSFNTSQLVWLLFEQPWLTLVPLLVLLVGFLWSYPDESWSSAAERKTNLLLAAQQAPLKNSEM